MFKYLFPLYIIACIPKSDLTDQEGSTQESPDETPITVPVDLEDPDQNLEAFVKTRGSLDPNEEIVFYWKGAVYNHNEADP